MKARTFFISVQTQTINGTEESLTTTVNDSMISESDVVAQFGNCSENSSFGNFNIFVESISKSNGSATSVLGKSSITPEGTPDTIDTVLIAAR